MKRYSVEVCVTGWTRVTVCAENAHEAIKKACENCSTANIVYVKPSYANSFVSTEEKIEQD